VDHSCQLAGGERLVAIGIDLDGGGGTERTPIGELLEEESQQTTRQRIGQELHELDRLWRRLREAWQETL